MMGSLPEQWMNGRTKSITFCVTEDCNLSCKYCYMTGKNSKIKMDFDTAKRAVDFILSSTDEGFDYEGVIWEFIGGEPFLEIELIDKISDYIKIHMFLLNHRWFNCYMFNFSSNGILYDSPAVQKYIKKNQGHVSIGLSIDGNKIKHDMQRVKKDGTGSYDEVVKNAALWIKQFPQATTKATFSHDDIPYLKDSIISLWNLGMKIVPANVVFEDVWQEGDDLIFENQLKDLADYIIDKEIWGDHSVRFFDPQNGFPATEDTLERNFCGSGKMLAIDCKGNLFPCIRFYDMSLSYRKAIKIGDIEKGIDNDKIRPFQLLSYKAQSTEKCLNCQVATGCAWCTGGNYDTADTDTIYQRATFICKMHKANMRANEYFWNKLSKILGYMPGERQVYIDEMEAHQNIKYLQFITSDSITPHCIYRNWKNSNAIMSLKVIEKGLDFAIKNDLVPVFLGQDQAVKEITSNLTRVFFIKNGNNCQTINENEFAVYDNFIDIDSDRNIKNSFLLINKDNITRIFTLSQQLFKKSLRINLRLEGIETWTEKELKLYEIQLDKLSELILEFYKNNKFVEINILSDIMCLDSLNDCGAGVTSFALAPNGEIYFCPAFYFDDPESSIGNLNNGINIKNGYLLKGENAPICSVCDAYHCNRCKFLNKKCTNEINTPSKMQCKISHLERNKARALQIEILKESNIEFKNIISAIDYLDPLEKILMSRKIKEGCV